MGRKVALVLGQADAEALQRILRQAHANRMSASDYKALLRLERRLRDVRNGYAQLDAAIIEQVRGAKPCSLDVKVSDRA